MMLKEFLEKKPHLRFMFTGGKGGVGKTVTAAGLAYHYASVGEKVLLASLNPIHSLSSLFDQDLSGGEIRKVEGVDNLYAVEVEIDDIVEKYKQNIANRLSEFLKWADIPLDPKPFIEIATTNPAFQESAMFDKIMDMVLMEGEGFDRVIFDTAAVANAVRLIGLSKIYGMWLNRMIESRKEALSLRVKLSFRKEVVMEEIKKDPLLADLLAMQEKFEKVRGILLDSEKTAFFFVTLPLSLPISVVKRFIKMVSAFDIPVGGVFVNMIIPKSIAEKTESSYVKNKFKEQLEYMKVIVNDLGEQVRSYIPLYEAEVRGLDTIEKLSNDMFSWIPDFMDELEKS
ncbi:MAG: ArsA family ATPase [Candidatus Njordarchaeia archaeon]